MGAAVAEACEWRLDPYPDSEFIYRTKDGRGMYNPACDLNAMHEAEKVLTKDQLTEYSCLLAATFNGVVMDAEELDGAQGDTTCRWSNYALSKLARASAAQRAEAFLKTLNLWKP